MAGLYRVNMKRERLNGATVNFLHGYGEYKLDAETRQVKIYEMIKDKTGMSVADIASYFGVSRMTIRRDLDRLSRSKLIERSYGKASIADKSKATIPFEMRQTINHQLKRKIADITTRYIIDKNIQSIYADGSTTAFEFVKSLPRNYPMTIFTNGLPVLNLLKTMRWIKSFAIGGFLDIEDFSFGDASASEFCKQIFVDATVISCSGLSASGIFENRLTGTQTRRIMQKNSLQNLLLADHTKIDSRGVFLLSAWDKIDTFITDRKPCNDFLKVFSESGTNVIWN
jgi:DeoR/GlpR family transcriptional regulator of sugar metabolism